MKFKIVSISNIIKLILKCQCYIVNMFHEIDPIYKNLLDCHDFFFIIIKFANKFLKSIQSQRIFIKLDIHVLFISFYSISISDLHFRYIQKVLICCYKLSNTAQNLYVVSDCPKIDKLKCHSK